MRPHVIEGAYAETLRDGAYDRLPGTVNYYPRQTGHAERHYATGRHLLIEIDSAWLERNGGLEAHDSCIALTTGWGPNAARRCLVASRIDGPLGGLSVESLVLELHAAMAPRHRPTAPAAERWLSRAATSWSPVSASPFAWPTSPPVPGFIQPIWCGRFAGGLVAASGRTSAGCAWPAPCKT
jgi:hypothetical protein